MATTIEPPTTARVILETSKGPLEIELWAKEVPIASRNFLQRCIEGYYNGSKFHRVLRGFMVQAGAGWRDNASGSYIADEFHSRLKFTSSTRSRGILGCANVPGKKNSNGSQFIITLSNGPQTAALNRKNTVFGCVVGDSIYNLARIESEGDLEDDGETPLYPVEIKGANVIEPYFDDLLTAQPEQPKTLLKKAVVAEPNLKKRAKKPKVKLSYDDDDEDEEGETKLQPTQRKRFKMKAAHEVMNDKSLVIESEQSKQPVNNDDPKEVIPITNQPVIEKPTEPPVETIATIEPAPISKPIAKTSQELEQEFELLKSSLKRPSDNVAKNKTPALSLVEAERASYLINQPKRRKKDSDKREAQTLAMLSKFTSKLSSATGASVAFPTSKSIKPKKSTPNDEDDNSSGSADDSSDDDRNDLFSHRFLPEHVESKDDSLITQYTGTKHNDGKFTQEDPEFLLKGKSTKEVKSSKKSNIGSRSGALMSTQKLREELRQHKLQKLSKD